MYTSESAHPFPKDIFFTSFSAAIQIESNLIVGKLFKTLIVPIVVSNLIVIEVTNSLG